MLQALVITLREGLEAFLIVAITLAYLRQTGRNALLPAAYRGIGGGLVASAIAGYFFGQADNQPLWEGILATGAALLVISMVIYMLRAARTLRADINRRLEQASRAPGFWAAFGVFSFVLLMITREGMETALLLSSVLFQSGMEDMAAGALSGLVLAAVLAFAWHRFGKSIRLDRFFQVTSVFLILFAAQLLLLAFHEFTEGAYLPIDNQFWHVATEDWAEGRIAQWISAALIAVPLLWFAALVIRDRLRRTATA